MECGDVFSGLMHQSLTCFQTGPRHMRSDHAVRSVLGDPTARADVLKRVGVLGKYVQPLCGIAAEGAKPAGRIGYIGFAYLANERATKTLQ